MPSKSPDRRHSLSYRFLFRGLRWLIGRVVHYYGPVRYVGGNQVPRTGAVLVVANHLADVDPIVLQIGCPRGVHFMAKEELFALRGIGAFMRWCGTFPVRRGVPDRPAIRHALDLLAAGEAVGVFPEGQLSVSGQLQTLLPGVALLIRSSGTPVVCAGIAGTPRMMPYGETRPRRARGGVAVIWGTPHSFPPDATTATIMTWIEAELHRLGAP